MVLRRLPFPIVLVSCLFRRAVGRAGRGLRRTGLPDILHEFLTLLPQNALNAPDGIALAIEQMAYAAQQIDILRPIETPASAPLHGPDFVEATFPEPQHVLWNCEFCGDFADGAERVRGLVHAVLPNRTRAGLPSQPRPRNCTWSMMTLRLRYLSSAGCSGSALIRCFRMAEGLNTITRRGEIGTSLPVLGLRPILCPLLRTTNEPNEDSLTVSPRSRQSVISLSTSSTRLADSVRDNPTFW